MPIVTWLITSIRLKCNPPRLCSAVDLLATTPHQDIASQIRSAADEKDDPADEACSPALYSLFNGQIGVSLVEPSSSPDPDFYERDRYLTSRDVGRKMRPPLIPGVDPASAPNDNDLTISITGTDFTAEFSDPIVLAAPIVSLGDNVLADVGRINSTLITATVPWNLKPDAYQVY